MIDVTHKLEAIKVHKESKIVWIKLSGEEEFNYILSNHPDTPTGYKSISHVNSGSCFLITKFALAELL